MGLTIGAVVTTYNYGRFIAGALDSVLSQTRPPDEIIVVDDGSTDDTAARVAAYADQGVRYLYRANGGSSAARNSGIQASRGDVIAFLDADDRWLPDKLARQAAHLEQYPAVGLVTGSERHIYESGQAPFYLHRAPVGAAWFYPRILVENTIGNPSLTLVRRACFDRVGLFDETLFTGEDWDMWIRIVRAFPVGVVKGVLIDYTRHATSTTAGKVWERYHSNQEFHRRYIGAVAAPGQRWRLRAAAQSMNFYYVAAALMDQPGQRPTALASALAAALLDPFYKPRNKAGMLLRTLCGRAAFDSLRGRRSRPRLDANRLS